MTYLRTTPRLIVLIAVVVAIVVAAVARAASSDQREFVTRSGSSFEVGGKPFRFVGFNLYDAAATDTYSCSPQTRLSDDELKKMMHFIHDRAGATVVRFWAYQTYTAGGADFSGVDRVIAAARDAGVRVIPVLEDGPGQCSTGQLNVPKNRVDDDSWYVKGYKQPYGTAAHSYRDYVRIIASHYRDEPTIMAWMLMNEAETGRRGPNDQSALVSFAQDVGQVIRSADRRHLITLGTQSNGAPGVSGPDFRAIYQLPVLDFAEVHDWAFYGSDHESMPGAAGGRLPAPDAGECLSRQAKIACSFAIAQTLGKPLVVGEAGIRATDVAERQRRAQLLSSKMSAAFAAGADGYLVWQLNTSNTDGYAVIPAQNDPIIDVMHSFSPK